MDWSFFYKVNLLIFILPLSAWAGLPRQISVMESLAGNVLHGEVSQFALSDLEPTSRICQGLTVFRSKSVAALTIRFSDHTLRTVSDVDGHYKMLVFLKPTVKSCAITENDIISFRFLTQSDVMPAFQRIFSFNLATAGVSVTHQTGSTISQLGVGRIDGFWN